MMLSIDLAPAVVTLGAATLVPRGSRVGEVLRVLGEPTRCLAVSTTNTLYLYDQLGLRFWAEPSTGLVSELQLVLETQPGTVFPALPFTGHLLYEGRWLALPVTGSQLAQGRLPGFRLNTDYQQYMWSVHELNIPYLQYTAFVGRSTDEVDWISIS